MLNCTPLMRLLDHVIAYSEVVVGDNGEVAAGLAAWMQRSLQLLHRLCFKHDCLIKSRLAKSLPKDLMYTRF